MTEWNDDRLDELNGRVKDGFAAVDKRFEQVDERFIRLEGEMKEGFSEVDKRFVRLEGEMKDGFAKVDERFARLEGEMKEGFAKHDKRFERIDERFEQVATSASVAEVNGRLDRIEVRMDRIYWAFVVLVLMVGGNLIAHSA